jgi:predicted Co/Zn/Cd cation transporter (cation efflux family)
MDLKTWIRRIFPLPFWAAAMAFVACCGGLIWVFLNGMENSLPAYPLYALSAYTLTALCVKLPGAIRGIQAWTERHPKMVALLRNEEFKFKLELYFEQFLNFAYGIFKIASGVIVGSAWIGCDGIYNMAQALIQLFQILRRRKPGTLLQQWKSYRFCGILILLMHLTLTGIVFQMVNWNRAEDSGQIMVIATAVFAFYKFTSAFMDIARDRKHVHPIDSSIRMLELAQAIFAIFSLQASMFHVFGTGAAWEHLLNIITGCTVCLLILSMGIYMIRRAGREIKKIKETDYGKSVF